MKRLFFLSVTACLCIATRAQNVGIGVSIPTEKLHVDSTLKVGKNQTLGTAGRKNLLKFGDDDFVTIGEEVTDDKLYIRFGDLSFMRSGNSIGNGYIGIQTEAPSASLDVNGSFRLRGNNAAAGSVLVSDAGGNAAWQSLTRTDTVSFNSSAFVANTGTNILEHSNLQGTYFSSVGGGQASMSLPLSLPQRAQITGVDVYCYDNSAEDLTFTLLAETNTTTNSFVTLAAATTTGSSSAMQKIPLTLAGPNSNRLVQNEMYSYLLSAYCLNWPAGNSLRIKSVVIRYTYVLAH